MEMKNKQEGSFKLRNTFSFNPMQGGGETDITGKVWNKLGEKKDNHLLYKRDKKGKVDNLVFFISQHFKIYILTNCVKYCLMNYTVIQSIYSVDITMIIFYLVSINILLDLENSIWN